MPTIRPRTAPLFPLIALAAALLAPALPSYGATENPTVCAQPEWPRGSRANDEQGIITLTFLIAPDGMVADTEVVRSTGFPKLDKASRDALSKCRFRPIPKATWMSMQYVWGGAPAAPSPKVDVEAIKAGAARGEAKAEFDLAMLYVNARPSNGAEFNRLLKLAADKGHPPALNQQAFQLLIGASSADVQARAFDMIQKSAAQGDAAGQYQMAVMLKNGRGTQQDMDAAIGWLRKAQAQQHEGSGILLGTMLTERAASPAELQEGITLLRLGASKFNVGAIYMLGRSLETGHGVAQDLGQAVTLYTKAAAAGHNAAQGALARLYESGQGVPADPERARMLRAQSEMPSPLLD